MTRNSKHGVRRARRRCLAKYRLYPKNSARYSVAEAARQVGYESPSQFSREYKRLFGGTPKETAGRSRSSSFCVLQPGDDSGRINLCGLIVTFVSRDVRSAKGRTKSAI